jgi:hypothetical protein
MEIMHMDKKTALHMALIQLDNLESLVEKFDYQNYMLSKIAKMRCEVKRQLTHFTADVICDY